MEKSRGEWKVVLTKLGHPYIGLWDDKNFLTALFRGSKERQELLNWLAPKILKCSGSTKKYPNEIALPDVYSQFVYIQQQEIASFLDGSLLKDKQRGIWRSIFWKIDLFWDKTSDANPETRSPEEQDVISRAQQALQKADDLLRKPLPEVVNSVPPASSREIVSQNVLLDAIRNFCRTSEQLNMDPAESDLEVDLATLKTLSEMVEAMKRM